MTSASQTTRVAVLRGGPSSEHEVSLSSGTRVLAALSGGQPIDVVIGKDGRWSVEGSLQRSAGAAIDLIKEKASVAFIALHGPYGEDGTIQGFLEVHGLPYTGSGVMASSLAMDKPRTKMVYRHAGLL